MPENQMQALRPRASRMVLAAVFVVTYISLACIVSSKLGPFGSVEHTTFMRASNAQLAGD